MSARGLHYFVWYRVAGDPACARAAITAMMLDVAMSTGVAGRLFERADDASTWMEVYDDVDDRRAFEKRLARAVAAHDVAQYADGARHVECFCAAGNLAS
jgi:hypothetical protein